LQAKKSLGNKSTGKNVKRLLNCLDYGLILEKINPSTQMIVDHRVERLCKQYSPNLNSKNIRETKSQAKKDNISINYF